MAEHGPTFRLRVLSALVLVPVALAVVTAGGWIYVLGVALLVTLMALEWRRLSEVRFGPRYGRLAGAATLAVSLGATTIAALGRPRDAVLCVLIGAMLAGVVARVRAAAAMWAGIGVALIGLPAVALVWLRSVPELGLGLLLWLLIVVWTTDTAAYAVGRRVGGPRLAPCDQPGQDLVGAGRRRDRRQPGAARSPCGRSARSVWSMPPGSARRSRSWLSSAILPNRRSSGAPASRTADR